MAGTSKAILWGGYHRVACFPSWRPILEDYRGVELPEIKLRLVHPISPMVVLDNVTGVLARDIKKTVAVWNADDLRAYSTGSSGNDPLPIPISTFDVLRPHTSSGRDSLFQQSLNAGLIKTGDRLIGSIGVICPTCFRGHTYFRIYRLGNGRMVRRNPGAYGRRSRCPEEDYKGKS